MFAAMLRGLSALPLPLLRFFGQIAAIVLRLVPTRTAYYGALNLEIAQPLLGDRAEQLPQLIQHAQRNEIMSYFEFVHIWGSSNAANIARIHQIDGAALFHDALAQGRGLILVVPHIGTWEVMNAWLSQYTAMTVMYKPVKHPQADAFIRAARSRERAQLVPTDESGVRQIFRTLKNGGVTAILPDHSPDYSHQQHASHHDNLIDWFGVPLYSSQLVAKLAQKTSATTLMIYAIRNDNGGFDMTITAVNPQLYNGGNQGTRILLAQIEQVIARHPEHYHWSYKRFKANPNTHHLYTMPRADAVRLIRRIQSDGTAV